MPDYELTVDGRPYDISWAKAGSPTKADFDQIARQIRTGAPKAAAQPARPVKVDPQANYRGASMGGLKVAEARHAREGRLENLRKLAREQGLDIAIGPTPRKERGITYAPTVEEVIKARDNEKTYGIRFPYKLIDEAGAHERYAEQFWADQAKTPTTHMLNAIEPNLGNAIADPEATPAAGFTRLVLSQLEPGALGQNVVTGGGFGLLGSFLPRAVSPLLGMMAAPAAAQAVGELRRGNYSDAAAQGVMAGAALLGAKATHKPRVTKRIESALEAGKLSPKQATSVEKMLGLEEGALATPEAQVAVAAARRDAAAPPAQVAEPVIKTPEDPTVAAVAPTKVAAPPAKVVDPPAKVVDPPAKIDNALTPENGALTPDPSPAAGEGRKTGGANVITEAERAARGLEPVEKAAYQGVEESAVRGRTLVEEGTVRPRELALEVAKTPRSLSADETGALIHDRMRLINEHAEAVKKAAEAVDQGDHAGASTGKTWIERIEKDLDVNDQALQRAGREWSQAGNARRMLVAEDYSLAGMLQRAKAKKGAALSDGERAKVERLHQELAVKNEQIRTHEARIAELETAGATPAKAQRTARSEGRVRTREALDKEHVALKRQLERILSKQTMNLGARQLVDTAPVIGRIVKNRIEAHGVTVVEAIDRVYTELKETVPDLTPRIVRDAFSGYGRQRGASSPAATQMRDLQKQMRLLSAIEDAEAGIAPERGSAPPAASAEVKQLRKQLAGILDDNGMKPKKRQPPATLADLKARTQERIEALSGAIAKGEELPATARRTQPYDPGLESLKMKEEALKRSYQVMTTRMGQSRAQRVGSTSVDALNAGRSVVTSVDLSAPGRQGWFLTASHPVVGAKALVKQVRAFGSEHVARQVDQEIRGGANAARHEASGLYLSPLDGSVKLTAREESFQTSLAQRIPGLGRLVRSSERAYITYLNKLRADVFDGMTKGLEKMDPDARAATERAIADFVNKATGRGSLGEAGNNASALLSNVFFSPRFLASRFQVATGQPMWGGTKASRLRIAREYVRTVGVVGTILYVAHLAGAEVDTDRRSPEFLKMRFGNVVVDVMGGLQQVMTFLSRMQMNETMNAGGEVTDGPGTREHIGKRFLRSKLSPLAGTAWNVMAEKDYIGQPVTPATEILRNVVPMTPREVYETAKEEDVSPTLAVAILNTLGFSTSAYPKR